MSEYEIGTELRSAHGSRWVKVGPNQWYVRGSFGLLDQRTLYRDNEVSGEVVGTGVTK